MNMNEKETSWEVRRKKHEDPSILRQLNEDTAFTTNNTSSHHLSSSGISSENWTVYELLDLSAMMKCRH